MTSTLDELLQQELQDIYDAEKQLVKALPKMAKAASSDELRTAITDHLEQTKGHVERLEQAFEHLGVRAKSKPCAAMKGLIAEGQETTGEKMTPELMDLAIIGAAQRVEHYEMAAYSTARAFAEHLGNQEVAELLQETLGEEEEANDKLGEISESIMQNLQTADPEEAAAKPAVRAKTKRSAGR